ncbi:MAG: hypothetical protein M3Z04_00875 [Chloroflexota bacterium]|nr:hypothetical protein [Chloroflexota bacterium]
MHGGVTARRDLVRALAQLGGRPRSKGGETIVAFAGTTIIIGRRDFSRSMICRVERKLAAAQITAAQLWAALGRPPQD